MVRKKPPTYLLYMREHAYNKGTFYIYIYILMKNSIYVLRQVYLKYLVNELTYRVTFNGEMNLAPI